MAYPYYSYDSSWSRWSSPSISPVGSGSDSNDSWNEYFAESPSFSYLFDEKKKLKRNHTNINGICKDFSALMDRDVDVTSNSDQFIFSSPSVSPLSESDQIIWNDNADSPQNYFNENTSSRYQGVRVKNTVKELIMQKREIQAQQCQTESEFSGELQQRKRSGENLSHIPVKRSSPTQTNPSSPENSCPPAQIIDEIVDILSKMTDSDVIKPKPLKPMHYPSPPSIQTGPPVSFFEWQINQEEERLTGLGYKDLTSTDEDGDTCLHIAVAQGKRALAFVLARKMAAVNVLDLKEHNKQSAFQLSVAANQHLIAQDLISLGAEIDTLDRWGRTVFHVCVEKFNIFALKSIQKSMQTNGRHANMETVNYNGLTALHVAVLSHNSIIRELSSCHMSYISLDTEFLIKKRNILWESIHILLNMGASVESKDLKSGRTVLHMAAEEANVELLRLFLDQPNYFSVINVKAFNGNTALHVVSSLSGRPAQVDAVRLLLRRGADPTIRNLENEQPNHLVPDGSLGDQVRQNLKGKTSPSRQ